MSSVPATKVCRKCGEEKPLSDFYEAKATGDGKQAYCKRCHSEVNCRALALVRKEKLSTFRSLARVVSRPTT